MFNRIATVSLIAFILVLFFGIMTFAAMGGSLAILALTVIATPLFSLLFHQIPEERSMSLAKSEWQSLPASSKLELIAEKTALPVLISHKDSTEIIYANSKAKKFFGAELIGRTVESEQDLPFKPVKMDGLPVHVENHPALRMKSGVRRTKMNVTWITPSGEKPFEFQMHELFAKQTAGKFLFVRIKYDLVS